MAAWPSAYNYNGFGFNNASNFFPFIKQQGEYIAFANTIFPLNSQDSAYQSIEIRDADFNLVQRSVVHGVFIEGPNLSDTELRAAYRYPLAANAEQEYFLFGFDFANSERWRVSKTDSNLNVLWDKHLEMPYTTTRAAGVVATPDGGCLIHGRGVVNDAVPQEIRHLIYKVDAGGNVTNSSIIQPVQLLKLYPNPASGQFRFEIPKTLQAEAAEMRMFDTHGKLMLRQRELQSSVGIGQLSGGAYWVCLLNAREQIIARQQLIIR